MLLTIIILPLLGAIISGFLGFFVGNRGSKLITTTFILVATILSYRLFYLVALNQDTHYIKLGNWIDCGLFVVPWEFVFDPVTVTMSIVVTTISSCVHIYSTSYMKGDAHEPRFMSYLSLFTFFMLILIAANNLLLLFVGWEGVGLCSYLLINYWFTRIEANTSSIKAIVMNRLGDVGVTLGILSLYFAFKSLDFDLIFALVPFFFNKKITFIGIRIDYLTITTLFLFVGVVAKSAQLGLHTWLPDAMEGPTPVSALIHAATMVTAGVFLLIRCSALFEFAPTTLLIIALLGSLTTFFAATAGMLQHDIKKVIAYSTCSQLGYMVFTCGLSAYNLSLFHLYTHAFFKALLFLTAGAIIHSLKNEQDLRRMGGLLHILPLSYIMMLVGSLALIGFPFLSGFYSKDVILETAFACICIKGTFTFWLGTISALCTVFYSIRLLTLIFFKNTNSFLKVINGAHEMDFIMALPLILLSFSSIFLGYLSKDFFIGMGSQSFNTSIFILPRNFMLIDAEFIPIYIKLIPTFISVGTSILFFNIYKYNFSALITYKKKNWNLYRFLIKKWHIDSIYNFFVANKVLETSYYFTFKLIDKGLIEHIGPKGIISSFYNLSKEAIKFNTGYIYNYTCAIAVLYIFYIDIIIFNDYFCLI